VRRRRISAAQSRSHTSRANHNPFASKVSLKLEPECGKLPFIEEVGRRIILGASLDLLDTPSLRSVPSINLAMTRSEPPVSP
jgi:hypothetical protein